MSQLIKPGTHPTITELFIKRIPVFECEAVIDYVVRFLILKISKKHHLGPFELNIMRNPRTKSTANPKDDVDTTGWVVFKHKQDHEVLLKLPPQEREIEYVYKGNLLIRTVVFRINRIGQDLVCQTPFSDSPYQSFNITPSEFEAIVYFWPLYDTVLLGGYTQAELIDLELSLTKACTTTTTCDLIAEPRIGTPCAWYDAYDARFRRAVVTKVVNGMEVTLEHVDYGWELPATTLELRRIPERYMEPPVEVMKAK